MKNSKMRILFVVLSLILLVEVKLNVGLSFDWGQDSDSGSSSFSLDEKLYVPVVDKPFIELFPGATIDDETLKCENEFWSAKVLSHNGECFKLYFLFTGEDTIKVFRFKRYKYFKGRNIVMSRIINIGGRAREVQYNEKCAIVAEYVDEL